ncbi:hypothetical protein DL764_005705 [Monosporascus ibericus]|uniref:Uncharacterized protein n=1 Tax=Monosporascus ibericus TaxID=155417 RepID=A0A4Q4TBT6_9PEZI|nr:hypothetical protein DL764_005705 [Monosporascus ibericus]
MSDYACSPKVFIYYDIELSRDGEVEQLGPYTSGGELYSAFMRTSVISFLVHADMPVRSVIAWNLDTEELVAHPGKELDEPQHNHQLLLTQAYDRDLRPEPPTVTSAFPPTDAMNDMSELDITLRGYLDPELDGDRNKDTTNGLGDVTSTDLIATLTMQMQMPLNENSGLNSLERTVQPIYSASKKPSDWSKVMLVSRYAYRSMSKPRLSDSGIKRDTDQEEDLTADLDVGRHSPSTSLAYLKSNSAIAAQGYVGKSTLWGTALASLLIAMIRYYIEKGRDDNYGKRSPRRLYVHPQDADHGLRERPPGDSTPDIAAHLLHQPDGCGLGGTGRRFSHVSPSVTVSPTPDQLSRMTPKATVSKMATEMPKKSLTEKNWNKFVGYGTYTSFG